MSALSVVRPLAVDEVMNALLSAIVAALLVASLGGCVLSHQLAAPQILPAAKGDRSEFANAEKRLESLLPDSYRAVQRAVITKDGKQFTCDGVLQVSPAEGHHLAIVSSFGVVANFRISRRGKCEVLKVTPLFREEWVRRYLARDLRLLFVPPRELQPAGRLADGSLVLQTPPDSTGGVARYVFSAKGDRWLESDWVQNGKVTCRAKTANFRRFAGTAMEVPSRFEVTGEDYQLDLTVVELTASATEGEA